jgi:mannonate dehydratase
MELRFSRRKILQGAGGAAVAQSLERAAESAPIPRKWPIEEGPETPKLCLAPGDGGLPLEASAPAAPPRGGGGSAYGGYLDPKNGPILTGNQMVAYERIRQLGVTHLLGVNVAAAGGNWTEESVRNAVDLAKSAGMVAYNAMINVPASVIYGKDTRAKDLEPFIASLQAAGKGGLTVVEYNFYAHRATEGYYETIGRANSGYTGFDSELDLLIDENGRVLSPLYRDAGGQLTAETIAAFPNSKKIKFKDLPPLANEGAHTLDEMWANITYFLKAVIPVAEKAGIRMALHPNDPPTQVSRGSQQIMSTLAGWKHLIGIVDSPANGITFDCGVTRELGEDAITTAEYFAGRKRINHVHYRNVQVVKPYEKYEEVFIDAGMNDMFGVMKALVRNKYTGTIYPEHPRALDYDRERTGRLPGYPGGGGYAGITFSVAYARAMMQAALESV